MALKTSPRTALTVAVSDRVFADTIIKQVARVVGTGYTQRGSLVAYIDLEVDMYAADAAAAEGRGEQLDAAGFSTYPVRLVADNNALVRSDDGRLLLMRRPLPGGLGWAEPDLEWRQRVEAAAAAYDAQGIDVMLQGDYYETQRNVPIANDEHTLQHIRAADLLLKRFA